MAVALVMFRDVKLSLFSTKFLKVVSVDAKVVFAGLGRSSSMMIEPGSTVKLMPDLLRTIQDMLLLNDVSRLESLSTTPISAALSSAAWLK